jgi:aspartyl-tRNA(Asn)/glutamyl-tRNA(Gln) amidotransferase subunit B
MPAYEAVIGLEIHAQLQTKSKAFCFVPNEFGGEPNTRVGPVSGGLPGALPVLNERAIELAVRAGLACNCSINKRSVFSRKNYFYPDLPKGYQITQFDEPICGPGWIEIRLDDGRVRRIRIHHIHMEEDAGKSFHLASASLVNLNRAGVPLVEIVSEPDLRGPQEASAYLRTVHSLLVAADVTDGNMEEGNFRCDVNVSVRPVGQEKLGTRAELKNINSFRFVEKAIDYEIARQIAVIEGGGRVVQETRGWDSAAGKSYAMRGKEEAHDYRYFPEPDLPPLVLDQTYIDRVRREMPELPTQRKQRFMQTYGVTDYDAEILTSQKALAAYFEEAVRAGGPPKLLANWIGTDLITVLKERAVDADRSPIAPERLAALLQLIEKGTISGKIAKTVFDEMLQTGLPPGDIVRDKGLLQVSDTGAVEAWVDEALAANPSQAEEYRQGKDKILAFLVGQVMKLSKGKANPPLVTEILNRKLRA